MEKRTRRNFSPEFRAEAIKLAKDKTKTFTELAADIGVSESCLRKWVKQAEVDEGGSGGTGPLTSAERDEFAALRREVRTLRMEREILKKATAFFAKENG